MRILGEWYYYFHLEKQKKLPLAKKFKSVDILTTYFPGEPKGMVQNTLLAMKKVSYPHKIFLCDEANDEELKTFCLENDIKHITRNSLKDAKAGNINNALKSASGEFCFILDPDHVPHPELLDRIIPHFNNQEIGFIQIVQGFYNSDNSLISKGAAQQTYQLYGPIMMSMNQLGTVQALGANCCFRRKALDSIDGHAAGLAEDLHTSMLLHAKGWKSLYVPEVLTKGLVPEDYHSYFKQQLKWSKGSFDLLFKVLPGIFKKLTFNQKMHYLILPQYYFFGVVSLIEILIPICSLLFFFVPWKINIIDFSIALLPFLMFSLLIHNYVQNWVLEESERGFHLMGGVLRNATWFIYVAGFLFSILNINVKYLPTPKENKTGSQILYIFPNIFFAALSFFSIIYGLVNDYTPFSLFMAGFAFINLILLGSSSLLAFPLFNLKEQRYNNKLRFIKLTKVGKKYFWIFRHGVYRLVREQSRIIAIILLILPFSIFFLSNVSSTKTRTKISTGDFFMTAIRNSAKSDLSNTKIVTFKIDSTNREFNLSFPEGDHKLFIEITPQEQESCEVFVNNINRGIYDTLLIKLSEVVKQYDRQFFISIQLNPLKGLDNQLNTRIFPVKLIKSWGRIVSIFNKNNCYNAIWVWPALEKENGDFLMPDTNLYDWTLVPTNDSTFQNFVKYLEFSDENLLKPVIMDLSESVLKSSVELNFSELNTHINLAGIINDENQLIQFKNSRWLAQKKAIEKLNYPNIDSKTIQSKSFPIDTIKGVCYDPYDIDVNGSSILNKSRLDKDFENICKMGANCLRVYRTDIYFKNILNAAHEHNLNLMVDLDIPTNLDFYSDKSGVANLKRKCIKKVIKHEDNGRILFWNIGDDVFGNIDRNFASPYSQKVKRAYLLFLNDLIMQLKFMKSDSRHMFSVPYSNKNIDFIIKNNGLINPDLYIGLNIFYSQHFEELKKKVSSRELKSRIVVSAFGPEGFWDTELSNRSVLGQPIERKDDQKAHEYLDKWNKYLTDSSLAIPGGFAYRWKEHPNDLLTWMGITSIIGTKKNSYFEIKKLWLKESLHINNYSDYDLVYNGIRVIQYIQRPEFFIANDYNIINSNGANPLNLIWALSYVSDDNTSITQFLGNQYYQKIDKILKPGQYRMHLYITDSSETSVTLTAPFAIY